MANFIGVNQGQNEYQVVVGTITNNTDFEIQINTTNIPSKEDALLAIEKTKQFIIRSTYPLL